MARSTAAKAALAAEALDAFLRDRRADTLGAGPERPAAGSDMSAALPSRPHDAKVIHVAGPGVVPSTGVPLHLPHADWLLHRLAVTGPATMVAAFGRAASGAGTIPWRLDLDSLEEDWFHLLINPAGRTLSLAGARVLAGQLRDAVDHRHELAVARVGHSRACPFDLHALVPVPADYLHLGPDHPDALAWLWQHWGTTAALRHVAPETTAGKMPTGEASAGEAVLRLRFWSADWTPWRAFQRIRADWPALRFDVQPNYAAA